MRKQNSTPRLLLAFIVSGSPLRDLFRNTEHLPEVKDLCCAIQSLMAFTCFALFFDFLEAPLIFRIPTLACLLGVTLIHKPRN